MNIASYFLGCGVSLFMRHQALLTLCSILKPLHTHCYQHSTLWYRQRTHIFEATEVGKLLENKANNVCSKTEPCGTPT